jgi:hypothetical protein
MASGGQDFWLANPWTVRPLRNAMFLANSHDYILRNGRHPSIALYVGRNEGFPPEALDPSCAGRSAPAPAVGYIPARPTME